MYLFISHLVQCYVDPLTGRKFYSKPQVTEYLRTVELNSSASQQNKNGLLVMFLHEFAKLFLLTSPICGLIVCMCITY